MEILTKSVSIPRARERKVRARLTERFISQIRRRALYADTQYMIWSLAVCIVESIRNAHASITRVTRGYVTRKRIFVRFKRIYLQNGINV